MKNFLYHKVPDGMKGEVLFPLNSMKDSYPELFEQAVSKYMGRMKVMQKVIPGLNCLWNDVIHLTAVPPAKLKEALVGAGMPSSKILEFYQIDPDLLSPEDTIVYLYLDDNVETQGNFTPFVASEIAQYSKIPQATLDHYKATTRENRFVHYRVPHILFKGTIDVSNCPIVRV